MSRGKICRSNPLRAGAPRAAARTDIPNKLNWQIVDVLFVNSRHINPGIAPTCQSCSKPAEGWGYAVQRGKEKVLCCAFCAKERITEGKVPARIEPIDSKSLSQIDPKNICTWEQVLENQRDTDAQTREEVYLYLQERPINMAKIKAAKQAGQRVQFMDSVTYDMRLNPMGGLPQNAIYIAHDIMKKEKIDQGSPEVFIPQGTKLKLDSLSIDSTKRMDSGSLLVNFRDEKGRQFSTYLSYDSKMDNYITDLENELNGDFGTVKFKMERGTVKGQRADKKITYLKLCKFCLLDS